jgi:hypothetical protein
LQEGTPEKKEQLIKKVTDAICRGTSDFSRPGSYHPPDIPKENIGDGGVPLSKKNP